MIKFEFKLPHANSLLWKLLGKNWKLMKIFKILKKKLKNFKNLKKKIWKNGNFWKFYEKFCKILKKKNENSKKNFEKNRNFWKKKICENSKENFV